MSIAEVRALDFTDALDAHIVLDACEAEDRRQRAEAEKGRR